MCARSRQSNYRATPISSGRPFPVRIFRSRARAQSRWRAQRNLLPFFDIVRRLRAEGASRRCWRWRMSARADLAWRKDFTRICEALTEEGYRFGALVIDAALFLPQSRRVFSSSREQGHRSAA